MLLTSLAMLTGIYSFAPKNEKQASADSYKVSTESKVEWIGSKKGGYHPGYFPVKSGEVTVDGGKITGGKFVIDLAGVKVTDAAGEKLEGHLKAPDFFDAAKFPEATFTITNVKYTSETAVEISGDLNIKGTNVPLKFPGYVRSVDAAKGLFAQAFFSLDKNTIGIAYGKGMVADDVQIAVQLFAKK